ncbi:MAG: M15 family metallopeptidase [bacterium]|nr:M15 family metallopeptidase [bacterium]
MYKLILKREQIHTGSLILVNKEYGFQAGSEDLLIPVSESAPEILLQHRAATLLEQLMLKLHGWSSIVPVSGWRSFEEQQKIWDDTLRESGPAFTEKYVARPGHSEHQTGLAIDLGLQSDHIDFICPDFPDSGVCRTFREKAPKYGFILRYPAGKEAVTGIGHEPWHFRYVGVPHAEIMAENGLTLEEYMTFIRSYSHGHSPLVTRVGLCRVSVSYVENTGPQTVIEIPRSRSYTVSGNNVDGFVLAEWEV